MDVHIKNEDDNEDEIIKRLPEWVKILRDAYLEFIGNEKRNRKP